MCEAEEVLNWLLSEIEQKSKEVNECGNDLYWAAPWMAQENKEYGDALDQLDELMIEFRQLAREAKQRLKESKRQVAA